MFNFFKKKPENNPISEIFSDLTTNQKMSVINLLLNIGVCDGEQGNQDMELQFLNNYVKILGVRSDSSMAYLENHGHEQIIEDLKSISKSQKEFLVVAAWEMITCDGRPNETELEFAGTIFNKIGVTDDQLVATIKKTTALMNHFNDK